MQAKTPTYLFICLANMNRSPTAEEVFRGLAKSKGIKVRTESAGLSFLSAKPLNKSLAKTADQIFVMETYMKEQIEQLYQIEPGRITVLEIPDIYEKNDPVLVKILLEKLEPWVEKNDTTQDNYSKD
jgi:predicted protein tyrosine phosphatase